MMSIFALKTRLPSYTHLGGANEPNELNAFREMIVYAKSNASCHAFAPLCIFENKV